MNLAVVIATYKNKDLFLKNLKHNLVFLKGCEVIIVNDDPRESLKKFLPSFKNLILLENEKNLGFAGAVNQGVSRAKGKYLMFLNDDARLLNESYKIVINHFKKDKNLFAVGFAQREKDNSLVGKNQIYWLRGMLYHKKADNLNFGFTAWAEGGACLLDKKKFLRLGGFDPLYSPFYWEDIDLSYRAYKRGWKVLFDPTINVGHYHETTIGKYFDKTFIQTTAFRNQFIFIWKNITDKNLFLSHLFFLPYHFFYFLLKRKKEFFWGFFEAFKKISIVMKKRNSEKKKAKLKDEQIFKFFQT